MLRDSDVDSIPRGAHPHQSRPFIATYLCTHVAESVNVSVYNQTKVFTRKLARFRDNYNQTILVWRPEFREDKER